MGTEQGEKRPELKPSHIQFPIPQILASVLVVPFPEPGLLLGGKSRPSVKTLMASGEKRPDIDCPVWHARDAEGQCLGDLLAENVPSCGDVAAPWDGSELLLAGPG